MTRALWVRCGSRNRSGIIDPSICRVVSDTFDGPCRVSDSRWRNLTGRVVSSDTFDGSRRVTKHAIEKSDGSCRVDPC